ncbi:MAG: glycoside hydrolase family 2 TIM barrel-domain containing protein [Lachnospiraceae bacterium]|nr:glycoside hydrolase family 2 TIM barrel-domain containing protein [Lachnospiraceae bacterium]
MKKISFNSGWLFHNDIKNSPEVPVTLPHDAMQTEKRLPGMKNGAAAGFFPGGRYVYRKRFTPEEKWKDQSVILELEGVYRRSTVSLNGRKLGGWINGYTGYMVDLSETLRFGEENELTVVADNSQTPNSRWYTGSGIYRDVFLHVGSRQHVVPDGIAVVTESIDPAVLHVSVETANLSVDSRVLVKVFDGQICVAEGEGADCRVTIPNARFWNAEQPNLYRVAVTIENNDEVIDESDALTGIRSLAWSANTGLLVNGVETKLRGGCLHHTNGILGAISTRSVELAKIKKLKAAGFNAIRSAHNPAGKALLEACDTLGMYVMDEAFDQWQFKKVDYDYSIYFDDEWQKDLGALIRKDRNHPSVIMYSIGNEIGDTGKPEGAELNRKLADFCRREDPFRPTINCINPVVSNMGGSRSKGKPGDVVDPYVETKNSAATASLLANIIVTVVPFIQKLMCKPEKVEKLLKPCFDTVDIVGLNYAERCYEPHHDYAPERIILGSETYPHSMARRWALVEKHPYVLGDFMWTAMDYLGEAGVGVPIYGTTRGGFNRPYPCVSGGCGAIDLIGHVDTECYAAAIAWGQYTKPYIAVRPVNHSGEKYFFGMWRKTDAVSSWSWKGCEGKTAEIEVYSPGSTVELFQDGQSLGKKPIVEGKADFTTTYRKGVLKAVCYDDCGRKISEDMLCSAGKETVLTLAPEVERAKADTDSLVFVETALTDKNGIVKLLEDRKISVTVEGAATLAAIGSGNPITEESFTGNYYTSWLGRMGFYVRSTGVPGEAKITVKAEGLESNTITLRFGEMI